MNKLNSNTINIIAIVLATIYVLDAIISTVVIFGFRKTSVNVSKEGSSDNTEQITAKVRAILTKKTWIYRRLIKAYPNFVAIKSKIKEIKQNIKEDVEDVKSNLTEKTDDLKNNIVEKRNEISNSFNEKKEDIKKVFKKSDENNGE